MINNISERNFITECKELKEKSNKIIHILQPQKCKIRKELANEIKQILKLHTTLNRKDLNLNYDSTKIGDIEIKIGDLTQLSGDFSINSFSQYQSWYGAHIAVFGLLGPDKAFEMVLPSLSLKCL